MQHLVVSLTGDPHGFVDGVLADRGRSRRIAVTVPNFMFALSVVAETDLVSALPRRLVAMHAARFGVVALEPPLPLRRFQLTAVVPKPAMLDAGLAWLFDRLPGTGLVAPKRRRGSPARRRRS
jgi:DNA-binding transcriptional LysR family regulator